MAKKTSVVLPGGIAGLVQQAQQSVSEPTPRQVISGEEKPVSAPPKKSEYSEKPKKEKADRVGEQDAKSAKSTSSASRKSAGNTSGSWEGFLDLAREYKSKQAKLATIYIDEELKTVLDRLKTANSVKMPTAALLSAIVAQFVYDNEKQIKKAIFDGSLI